MKKPVIGVSGSYLTVPGDMFPGYIKSYVNNDYITSVVKNGGVPYIIPIVADSEIIKQQCENIDALILSGGQDVNPLMWGEEPGVHVGTVLPIRDEFDKVLYETMKEMGKPILGICRGFQLMNVLEGGDLHQDIALFEGSYVKHWQGHSPSLKTHTDEFIEGSKIREILGCESALVNSFHHLTLRKIGENLDVTARSKDGLPEVIELKGDNFVMGVQFHPEMLAAQDDETFKKIFQRLVAEASKVMK